LSFFLDLFVLFPSRTHEETDSLFKTTNSTPTTTTNSGVGPAVSARRADEQVMWRRAEAIAAACKDDSPQPKRSSATADGGGRASSGSASSSSSRDGGGDDDSLAWDEEEVKAPEPAAAEAEAETEAEAPAETTEAATDDAPAAAPAAGEKAEAAAAAAEEVAIDEAYLGPDSVVVTITGCNDGGLLTSLAGLPAFIPFSQVEAASLGLKTEAFSSRKSDRDSPAKRAWLTAATAFPAIGTQVRAVPTEVDAESERIVLSVRAATELSARQQLRVGALVWGTVRKAASYGLFVGIDDTRESALLHATNISRGARLPESPLEVLPLGARVRALVVGMDQGGRRLSLSTAEIEENDGDMLVDPERVYAGADEQALYFRRHLEALAAQEAAGGGRGYGNGGNDRRNTTTTNNNNYDKRGNGNNRRNYDDDDGNDGNREWSSG
jgi:predicted RNA-binding protein with RPS1 domain